MRILGFSAVIFLFLAGLCGVSPSFADPKPVASDTEILPYLERVIAWQRQTQALQPTLGSARESLLKSALTQGSANVLKFSFAFARTQAQEIDKTSTSPGGDDSDGDRTRLQAAAVKVAQHVAQLQAQIAGLTDQLAKANRKAKPAIQAQLDDANGQLKFATAQQELIANLLGVFNSMVSSGNTGLTGKIASLSETVTQTDKPVDASNAGADKASPDAVPSGGLLQVIEDLFKLWRQINDLRGLESTAADLRKTDKAFLDRLRDGIKTSITQGSSLGVPNATPAAGAPTLAPTLDSLLADFKELSAAVVPVTQTNVWLDASAHTLEEWQTTVRDEIGTLLRRLAVHLAVLGALILIPVIVSELVRRATDRYIKDDRRQRQLRTVRRTLLTIVIFIIVALNLVTEVGSFATFAGFIVGGLAVAFQNVLLSFVAFFMFYGRYSVRAGDRVSVAGVIGDVVHVGALRFYVRELDDKNGKLEPSGRVAAFPNSVLFQTSAFYKYM